MNILILSLSITASAFPIAIIILPQLGSLPKIAVLTNDEDTTAFETDNASLSFFAPFTSTVIR